MELNFREYYNINDLMKIITTPSIIKYLQEKNGVEVDEEYNSYVISSLRLIAEKLKDGHVSIKYTQKNEGRYYVSRVADVKRSFGLQSIYRPIRHFLTSKYYIDIDIINSQPSIVLYLCNKFNIFSSTLERLVLKREEVFEELYNFYDNQVNKEQVKKLFIAMLNLGSYKTWLKQMKQEERGVPEYIINLSKELKTINDIIIDNNPWVKQFKDNKPGQISLIYQRIENEVLMMIISLLTENNLLKDDVCSLQFDGIQILKPDNTESLIKFINDNLKLKYPGIAVKSKPLDEGLTDADLKAARDILSKDLFYFNYKDLENYLYGEIGVSSAIDKNGNTVVSKTKLLSDYSIGFLKSWYLNNVKIIDFNGKQKYLIRVNDDDMINRENFIRWCGVDKKKKDGLNCNMFIKCPLIDNKDLSSSESLTVFGAQDYAELYDLLFKENDKTAIDIRSKMEFYPYLYETDNTLKKDTFNVFTGFTYKKLNGDLETQTNTFENSLIFNHIKEITCNGDENSFKYVLDWIAHLIQHPRDKHRVSLIQYGIQGTGKDTFCDFISGLIDNKHCYRTKNIKSYLSDFNSLNAEKLLIVFNEVDDKSSKYNHDLLKHIIDSKVETIEPKFCERYEQPCYKRFIFNTNNKNAFQVELSNSRYFMLETSAKRVKDFEYFSSISKLIKDKDYMKSAFHYFATRDISSFIPYVFPTTKYEKEQIVLNLKSPIEFIKELVDSDQINQRNIKKASEFNPAADEEEKVSPEDILEEGYEYTSKDLYGEYKMFCANNGYKPMALKTFITELETLEIQLFNVNPKSQFYTSRNRYMYINKASILAKIQKLVNKDN